MREWIELLGVLILLGLAVLGLPLLAAVGLYALISPLNWVLAVALAVVAFIALLPLCLIIAAVLLALHAE